ncbi:MAG TPA: cupredoxin family copper-binding protein [Casimicrobiaceae bacterium]|nr:cupredoxin family copper-binding protein [Casimicrobiaceae bacterium]
MRFALPYAVIRPIRGVAVALAGTAIVAVFAIHASAAPPAKSTEVAITKFAFAPKEITIVPGTQIVWTNHDDTPHSVAANDKSFSSKGLDTDDRFEHVFASEGDFNYICTVHPFMTGVVHVRK